jgi:hypothetical protein
MKLRNVGTAVQSGKEWAGSGNSNVQERLNLDKLEHLKCSHFVNVDARCGEAALMPWRMTRQIKMRAAW